MDLWSKTNLLSQAAQWDACQGCAGAAKKHKPEDLDQWISFAAGANGRPIPLLKVLQSNVCQNDCGYCAFRNGRDIRRSAFTPDELASLMAELYRMRRVEGLFLSSGVAGSTGRSSERMLATVEILRRKHRLPCYIHLKILPGADDACIEASLRWADRVSVNLEAPSPHHLRVLSGKKEYKHDLIGTLRRVHQLRRRAQRRVSITTQFVVGPAQEADSDLLGRTAGLYKTIGLARAYYSAFTPIRDTPLENEPRTPVWREHRLYQADWLLRFYGFDYDDLVFDSQGNLPREVDPKLMWARHHPEFFPVEMNSASRRNLLRVPGIGPVAADRIMDRRRLGTIRELSHAGIRGAIAKRASPYVLLDGHQPAFQHCLWSGVSA